MLPPLHPLPSSIAPPARFTYPFCYTPHPLCVEAARIVQRRIAEGGPWRADADRGKMFGVLVVADAAGRLGFLAAFSGLLAGRSEWPWFVPPVVDALASSRRFAEGEERVAELSRAIGDLETRLQSGAEAQLLAATIDNGNRAVDRHRAAMVQAKARRDATRRSAGCDEAAEAALQRESQWMKAELRRIRKRAEEAADEARRPVDELRRQLDALRNERRQLTDDLQRWLFDQYHMLNARGQRRTLTDIFAAHSASLPPSGAGECCAPKLLQYAFEHDLKPLCMAEFWWGDEPRGELRRHLDYYPACRGKCLPILTHMLQGLDVDPDPLSEGRSEGLSVVYEDRSMCVVDKPSGLLSVPGRSSRPSVQSLLADAWGAEASPLMVHRLDMDTSGLLLVAKTAEAQRSLQAQFMARSTRKTYVALLSTDHIGRNEGRIALPLRPDPLDRPRQIVDATYGREAVTYYRAVGLTDGHVRLELHPLTGRTHQLRVHCAHPDGLNAPILGDRLYGTPAARLFLHAAAISITHPETGAPMVLKSKAGF